MKFKISAALFVTLLLFFKGYTQEEQNDKYTSLPSIYTLDQPINLQEYTFEKTINDKLNLNDFKFLIVDIGDLRDNFFSVNMYNIGRSASTFVLESYRSTFLYKSHFSGFDLRNMPWRYTQQDTKTSFTF